LKILVISCTYPEDFYTCTFGVFRRFRMFLEALTGIAEVEVLFYVNPDVDASPEQARRMGQLMTEEWNCPVKVTLCRKSSDDSSDRSHWVTRQLKQRFMHLYYHIAGSREQREAFERCLDRRPDAVFVHQIASVYPLISSRRELPPVFLDLNDVEHILFLRGIRQPPYWRSKFLLYFQLPSLIWLERSAIKLAQRTFVCSERDRRYLSDTWRLPKVSVIPNAIALPKVQAAPAAPVLLFIGAYAYGPNAVAADYLITRIWPIIRSELPDARLILAGSQPECIACYGAHHEGVEFAGFVEDLDALYHKVRVVCCTILAGGGTRVKLIEAAAYAKAIVSTTIGAEGLELVDNKEILLRDDALSFAQACLMLLRDRALCETMGLAARARAENTYDNDVIVERIKAEITGIPRDR
jgi:glycosyltransferase involved in cell wall biosynthesis